MRLIPYADEHLWLSLALEEDTEAMKNLGGPRPREAILKVHPRRVAEADGLGLFLVIIPDEGNRPAGTIGIWESEHEGSKIYEMGWMLLPEFHGRGIATEAGRMVLERARADPLIDAVYAFPGSDNGASNAICRKLGFEKVGETDVDFSGRMLHVNSWRLDLSAER
jgi:RimJ/RimL family protein N-acetyltransferase